jgi:hypothetical protein
LPFPSLPSAGRRLRRRLGRRFLMPSQRTLMIAGIVAVVLVIYFIAR